MVKHFFYIVILSLLFCACNNSNSTQQTVVTTDTTTVVKPITDTVIPRLWIVKDSSLYSGNFLNGLRNNPDSVSLVDSYIVNRKDTVYFPDYFEGNKQYVFEGAEDSIDYKLQVFNCTYTKLQFIFSGTKKGKLVQHYYGEAQLLPTFFLAHASLSDDKNATAFDVTEYYGENDKYMFQVSIGSKDSKLLGSFLATPKDSIKGESFSNCPILESNVNYVPKHRHN